jgi:CxxC motif-containing protein (DUF1111 family)
MSLIKQASVGTRIVVPACSRVLTATPPNAQTDPVRRGSAPNRSRGMQALLLQLFVIVGFVMVGFLKAQFVATDPGVRGGPPGAGGPIPGLTTKELKFFESGLDEFQEVEPVSGGLGPRFNSDSCSSCHLQPAVGGTSPSVNPQVAVATLNGATNVVPFFITLNGPVREARFKRNPDGTRDGGVHNLYVITGRADAPGCNIAQPDFNAAASADNLIFRIPTPMFGAGLIELIDDSAILANKSSNLAEKRLLGISGHENRERNAGTITRIGWKAQNKSLHLFSGEAYNVEMGVTNEMFQTERDETPSCRFNGLPEDTVNFELTQPQKVISDVVQFANFMRFLATPTPAPATASKTRGLALFNSIGCAHCHTPSFTTASSTTAALSNKVANLFSDLLVHHMGPGLADDIVQGNAGPDEFRTSPLWGLGQRLFFLHDGRTSDVKQAILEHKSPGNTQFPASEANAVIDNFNRLSEVEKQDILNFLRGL